MEPKYQKAYAIEGIAKKWIEDENEEDYVDTGDMLDDFRLVLELSRELMKMLEPPTLTIFRKYPDGDVIALFPEIEGAPNTCMCYVHVGQHGSSDYGLVISRTKKATPEEYADLKTELESIGYVLKVRQKWIRRRG